MSAGFRIIERNLAYTTPKERRRIKMEMLFWRVIKFTVYLIAFAFLVQIIGQFSGNLNAAVGLLVATVIWDLTRWRI